MYNSRASVQSTSSNTEAGDAFQLYERRFGNAYEASQIYDILKLKVVLLPGGKDLKQGPIIIFPSESGIHEVSEYDVITCLVYLGSIPSERSIKKCFSIIIDNQRKTLSKSLNFILQCCQKSFDNAISDIFVVEEQTNSNSIVNGNLTSANVHVVSKSQLKNHFDYHHLLPSLGGTLNYDHEAWLMSRLFIESYVKEAKALCSELDVFTVHLSSNLFQQSLKNVQTLWTDYANIRGKAEEFVGRGRNFCARNKPESIEEEKSINSQRTSTSATAVEKKTTILDDLWKRKDVEQQQKVGISSLEKEMKEVVDWILGPGEKLLISQTGIGRDYESADELRKQHERLELKCLDSYGKYAELRHVVEAYTRSSMTEESKAAELEAQRDYMDTVHRSFAKRLEQRRNTVVADVKFHRVLEEISALLEEIKKHLGYKVDLETAENLLDSLNALSEKLDFCHSMANRDGSQLKDMLCLPIKNAYSQDANINREPDINFVESCLEQLNSDMKGIQEALNLKKLELQQYLQLKISEQNIEQAIAWIKELDGLMNSQTEDNRSLKDLEKFQEELVKGENTAKNSFDYGQQLLKPALYLRRLLELGTEPNTDQANRLNEAWKLFSKGSNENAARRTALAIFDKKSDEFLQATENLMSNLDDPGYKNHEFLREFGAQKKNLDAYNKELQWMADDLNKRIQKPILLNQGQEKEMKFEGLHMVENIKTKLKRMDDKYNQLNLKWITVSQNGNPPSRNAAYEMPNAVPDSQQRRNELRSYGSGGAREVFGSDERINRQIPVVHSNAISLQQHQLHDWLESNTMQRIMKSNSMGSTLESVEDFYEKHVESLQAMKTQEHFYSSGRLNRIFPQQWNVVQEIIKQRITLALSLIKFHLSVNKAAEDLKKVEMSIASKNGASVTGTLKELDTNDKMVGKNASEFLDLVSNQEHEDEYLNVEEPKNFVRDILDQWKQKKSRVEKHLLSKSVDGLLNEANSINKELSNMEDVFINSPPSTRNMVALNNKMEDLHNRITALGQSCDSYQKSATVEPNQIYDMNGKLNNINKKYLNVKRLMQQANQMDFFSKDFSTPDTEVTRGDVHLLTPLQNATAKKGESLKLSCHIKASPVQKIQLKWLKDGTALNCNGDKYVSCYKNGQCDLVIHAVSNEDSGKYTCIAADGYEPAISTAEVLVEASPTIKEPLRDQSVKEGEAVEFSVKVAGSPSPTVKWYLNGKEISNSPDFQIRSHDGVHTLRISEVFDEDKGLYTVAVKNKYGEVTDKAKLKVAVARSEDSSLARHSRPGTWSPSSTGAQSRSTQPVHKNAADPKESKILHAGFLKPLTDKTSEAGEDIIVECSLPLFPVPSKITWYKDNIEITKTMPSIRTSSQYGVCRLVIERADGSHSGKYVCKVHLNDNIFETSMFLFVKDKHFTRSSTFSDPKYSPSMSTIPKLNETSANVSAPFQLTPFESSLRSQTVPWQPPNNSSESRFVSRNSSAPQFVKKMENNKLVENSFVSFSCKVSGEPAPNIQWYHNGRLIRPSGKYRMKLNKDGECSLAVADANKQDAGYYTCCALNVTGRDVCSAELLVEGAGDIDTTSYVEPETLKKILMPKSSAKTDDIYSGVVEVLDEPTFSKSSVGQVSVDEGETARIDCKVYGHPAPDLSWFKNGKEILRGGRFQVVLNQEGMQSLVIKSVQLSDAGIYTCRAHNKAGQATMDFALQVDDSTSKQRSKISLSRAGVNVRTSTESVLPGQTQTNYISSAKIFSDSTKMKMSSKQAELQRSSDQDESIQSPPARRSSSPKMLDHFPPRFLVTPDPVEVEEGGRAKFWAKLSSNPPASAVWSINGLDIFSSSRFNVYFDGLLNVLEIMKARKFDDGEVKISARNYLGEVEHACHLRVIDPVDLRSHLHPSTDPIQSQKRSTSSLEIVSQTTTKGPLASEFNKKLVTTEGAGEEPRQNVGLDDGGRRTTTARETESKEDHFEGPNVGRFPVPSKSRDDKVMGYDASLREDKSKSFRGNAQPDVTDGVDGKVRYGLAERKETIPKSDRTGGKDGIFSHEDHSKHSKSDKFSTSTRVEVDVALQDDPSRSVGVEQPYAGSGITSSETRSGGSFRSSETITTEYGSKIISQPGVRDSENVVSEDDRKTFQASVDVDLKSVEDSRKAFPHKPELGQERSNFASDGKNRFEEKTVKDYRTEFKSYREEDFRDSVESFQVEDKGKGGRSYTAEATSEDKEPDSESLEVDEEDERSEEFDVATADTPRKEKTGDDKPRREGDSASSSPEDSQEERRAREQKYISTVTEEITFKDVNNIPQKFSTRLLKTVEYTKTNSYKSSTRDEPDKNEEDSRPSPPFVRHAASEFQWDIDDSKDSSDINAVEDHYRKWKEEASVEISENVEPNGKSDKRGGFVSVADQPFEKNLEGGDRLSTYIDKAAGDHLEISNKGVQYDAGRRVAARDASFDSPMEKSVTIQDIETTDEITVETKVTQVKTVSLQLSEVGDINLTETTQVQTDTDMKETKKTREREELVVSHVVSNVTEVLGQGSSPAPDSSSNGEVTSKYDLFATWDAEPGVFIALHPHEPDSDEVMSLHEGERLELLEENSEDWWYVRKFFDGRQGFVPSRFLQSKSEFDKSVSDKIAQQIDRIEEDPSTKVDEYGEESSPQMMKLLSDILIHDGDPASFECVVTGNPRPSITWFHNSKVVKPSPDFLQFYDPDCLCSLSVKEVFPEDGGRYTMVAKNIFGIASSSAELVVLENESMREKVETEPSGSPILVTQPKHLVLDEGQSAKFVCRFKGKPPIKISWFKDGQQLSPSDKMRLEVLEEDEDFVTVELSMTGIDESHMGRYRALASNGHGEAEAFTSLVVKAQPKVLDFKASLKKTSRSSEKDETHKQEEHLPGHSKEDSSFETAEVMQHDFRSFLKPSSAAANKRH